MCGNIQSVYSIGHNKTVVLSTIVLQYVVKNQIPYIEYIVYYKSLPVAV